MPKQTATKKTQSSESLGFGAMECDGDADVSVQGLECQTCSGLRMRVVCLRSTVSVTREVSPALIGAVMTRLPTIKAFFRRRLSIGTLQI